MSFNVQLFLAPHGLWPACAHSMSQARMLEWVANSFSRGSSRPKDLTCISCQCRCQRCHGLFTTKPPGKLYLGVERTLTLQQNPLAEHNCALPVYILRNHLSCYLHMVSGRKEKNKNKNTPPHTHSKGKGELQYMFYCKAIPQNSFANDLDNNSIILGSTHPPKGVVL